MFTLYLYAGGGGLGIKFGMMHLPRCNLHVVTALAEGDDPLDGSGSGFSKKNLFRHVDYFPLLNTGYSWQHEEER